MNEPKLAQRKATAIRKPSLMARISAWMAELAHKVDATREGAIGIHLDGTKKRRTPRNLMTRRDPSKWGRDVTRTPIDICK